jgi:hypothetical protein
MTDRAQSNNLYRYLSQQRADKELYEEQCDDFRDLMDESINNMVERYKGAVMSEIRELELKLALQRRKIALEISNLLEFEDTEFLAFELVNKDTRVALALKRELEAWLHERGIDDTN